MAYDFSGKTALVTGAASGIGAACVEALAKGGAATLVLVDRDADKLDALDLECQVVRHAGDVADAELWARVEVEGHRFNRAVVNAGIAGKAAPIVKMEMDDWRKVMAVNLDGAFLSLRTAMRNAAEDCAIVLTASVTGIKANPGTGAYASSKAAVMQLVRIAAVEGAQHGIRVNAIAPGGVDTPLWDTQHQIRDAIDKAGGDRAAVIAGMAAQTTPLGRFASADEIAAQVMFLLSDAASTITGTTLVTDGGFSL